MDLKFMFEGSLTGSGFCIFCVTFRSRGDTAKLPSYRDCLQIWKF